MNPWKVHIFANIPFIFNTNSKLQNKFETYFLISYSFMMSLTPAYSQDGVSEPESPLSPLLFFSPSIVALTFDSTDTHITQRFQDKCTARGPGRCVVSYWSFSNHPLVPLNAIYRVQSNCFGTTWDVHGVYKTHLIGQMF